MSDLDRMLIDHVSVYDLIDSVQEVVHVVRFLMFLLGEHAIALRWFLFI